MNETSNEFYVPGLMDLSKYQLVRTEPDSQWDSFVESSPQGTIFSTSAFLNGTGRRLGLWYCLKGKAPVGGVALIESEDGRSAIVAPHVIHGGPMFAPAPPEQNRSQVISEEFRIISACLRDLADSYDEVAFACGPAIEDLRPVQWHNYGTDARKFDLTLRYTSYLDLVGSDLPFEQHPVYLACNKSRRQEIRYGVASGIRVEDGGEAETFLDLYRRTFERQGQAVSEEELSFLSGLLGHLSQAGRLRVYTALTAENVVGSVAVFGTDAKRAYYLYGANNPDLRDTQCGTMALFQAFLKLGQDGFRQVDLEGINSPKRGYFKLSFGGTITPYFQARMT